MIQPSRTASRMNAMNPPTRASTWTETYRERAGRARGTSPSRARAGRDATASGVERDLLVGRRERPGDLHARSWRNTKRSWLGGRSPSGWAGRKVAHGPLSAHRAEQVLMKEAVLAARFRDRGAPIRHARSHPVFVIVSTDRRGHQSDLRPPVQRRFPENAGTSQHGKSLQTAGTFVARPSGARNFRSFAGSAGRARESLISLADYERGRRGRARRAALTATSPGAPATRSRCATTSPPGRGWRSAPRMLVGVGERDPSVSCSAGAGRIR